MEQQYPWSTGQMNGNMNSNGPFQHHPAHSIANDPQLSQFSQTYTTHHSSLSGVTAVVPRANNKQNSTFHARSSTNQTISVPSHEVFVGNLSYFCQEHDLFTLFDEYSHAKNVRIVWNEDHSRPLMYGFVVLASQQEVMEIKKLLDGHLFMGRHLRCVGHCL